MTLYSALSKSILAFFAFMLVFTSSIWADEMTQEERTKLMGQMIPIITMLLMDDEDSVAPLSPMLSTPLPPEMGMPSTTVEIKGEVGAKVYVNGVYVARITSNGKATIPLTFYVGSNIIRITLKDKAGNESKPLVFSVRYEEVTLLGYVLDPIVNATIEIANSDGNLVKKIENTTMANGSFSVDIPKAYAENQLIVKVYGGEYNGAPYNGTMVSFCTSNENCYLTPYTTLVNQFINGYAGTDEEKKQKAIVDINSILGIQTNPFKNNHIEDIEKMRQAVGLDGADMMNFAETLYEDSIDGYLDTEAYKSIFENAHIRKEEIIAFEVEDTTVEENSTNEAEDTVVSLHSGESSSETSAKSLGYPSDVVLMEESNDINNSSIIYYAFNVGVLQGKINVQTQVVYDVFSSHLELVFLPLEEKEEVVNALLNHSNFVEATQIYDDLYTYNSSNNNYYDALIDTMGKDMVDALPQKQVQKSRKVMSSILSPSSDISKKQRGFSRKLVKGIEDESVTLNINNAKNNNPFEIMKGMLLNIAKPATGGDQIVFDFPTNIALYYAIAEKSSFLSDDWITSLLDTNLINPKVGLLNVDAIKETLVLDNKYYNKYFNVGYAKTAMNIANFDNDFSSVGTSKDFIVYRSKQNVLLDAPFIMNTLAVVDLAGDLLKGISLTKKLKKKLNLDKKWLKKTVNHLKDASEMLERNKDYIVMADELFNVSKDVSLFMGIDITTIDQRYGQVETLLNQIRDIVTIDDVGGEEELDTVKIANFLATFWKSKTKKKHKYNVKKVLNYYVYYKLAYMVMDTFKESTLSKYKITNKLNTALAVAKWKSGKTLSSSETKLKNNWKKLKKKYVLNILGTKKYAVRDLARILGIEHINKINDYLLKLKNLNASIVTDSVLPVMKNIIIQLLKDTANSSVDSMANAVMHDMEKMLVKLVGGGYVQLAKAGNKLAPMVYDAITKPVAVAMNIERNSENTFKIKSIVPPAFENINYLKFTNPDYVLWNTANVYKRSYGVDFMTVDSTWSTNVLMMHGTEFDFNNVAHIVQEDLAQGYFEKHEDDNVIFADWHVYQQESYDFADTTRKYQLNEYTAFSQNYWAFAMTGEKIDCINSVWCNDEQDEYTKDGTNVILDDYLGNIDENTLNYFSFDTLWSEAGHIGGGVMRTPGIYSVQSHLSVGKNSEVKYASKFNFFVVSDYDYSNAESKSHKDVLEEQSKYQETEEGLKLYLKLHREDSFNYFSQWNSFKKGNDFYLYAISPHIFDFDGPKAITLGKTNESVATFSPKTTTKILNGDMKLIVIDSIMQSYLEKNNISIYQMFLTYVNRKEGGVLARPFMVLDLNNLEELALETDHEESNTTSTLKKTGQTKSYDENGDEVTDGSIKDDGYYQKGVTPSYTRDDESDIVTDHVTSLEWQDDAEAKTVMKNWEDAKAYCVAKGSGWRLPTVVELQSIVVDGALNPSIDTTAFLNYTTSSDYWSSATHANDTSYAWIVYFYSGYTSNASKSNTFYVRCVR